MKKPQTPLQQLCLDLLEIIILSILFGSVFLALANAALAAPLTNARRAVIEQTLVRAGIPVDERPLMLAIAEVESNYDVNAIGKAGEIGAWQLHPKWHKVPPTPAKQAAYAYKLLLTYKRLCGNLLERALTCYNLGPAKAIKLGFPIAGSGYARKVFNVLYQRPSPPNTRQVRFTADTEQVR